jgi:NAD+ kinase
VQYHVTARDDATADSAAAALEANGFEVVEASDGDAIIVVLGGDGSILHAAREYEAPTILPVRTGTSKGHRTSVDEDELVAAVERIETGRDGGAVHVDSYDTLAARGEPLPADYTALNDVCLHHREPTLAAEFEAHLHTAAGTRSFDDLIGDGLVVATPFGSSAYFRAITGRTFEAGIGVAFNNIHHPPEAPESVRLPPSGRVEVAVTETQNAAAAVLTRDNDPGQIRLDRGESVEITRAAETVDILRVD